MVKAIKSPLIYIARIDSVDELRSLESQVSGNEGLLTGEYGTVSPLYFHHEMPAPLREKTQVELILKNRNRDLAETFLITASLLGFAGAVIATGTFDLKPGMAKPVYDLDASQALRLALDLKRGRKLREDFLLGVRAASGSEASRERARYFIDNGADLIVITDGGSVPGLEERTIPLRELKVSG